MSDDGLEWFLMLSGGFVSLCLTIAILSQLRPTGKAFFHISWRDLSDVRLWYEAAYQVLLSLGVGFSVVLCLASHNKYHVHLKGIVYIVCIIDVLMSLLSALVVFAVLGVLAHAMHVPVSHVVKEGVGLMFVTWSSMLAAGDFPHVLLIALWLSVAFISLSNSLHIVSTLAQSAGDFCWSVWQVDRLYTTAACLGAMFLLDLVVLFGGGFELFRVLDSYVLGLLLLLLCLVKVIIVAYGFGYLQFDHRMQSAIGESLGIYWRVTWCYGAPIGLILLIPAGLFYMGTEPFIANLSAWWHVFGAVLLVLPVLLIVGIPLVLLLSSHGETWRTLLKIRYDWDANMEQLRHMNLVVEEDGWFETEDSTTHQSSNNFTYGTNVSNVIREASSEQENKRDCVHVSDRTSLVK